MPAINLTSIVCRTALEASRIESDLVLFDDRVGKYFATGPVGADIWYLIGGPIGVSEIVDRLLADYDIDRPTCEREVLLFLNGMSDRGLAKVSE